MPWIGNVRPAGGQKDWTCLMTHVLVRINGLVCQKIHQKITNSKSNPVLIRDPLTTLSDHCSYGMSHTVAFKFWYIHVLVSGPLVLAIIVFINIIPIHSMFKSSRSVRSARCKRNPHRRWTSENIFPIYSSSGPI